jgi:integrase
VGDPSGVVYPGLMLLAAFTSLRWAELTALRPEDIDLDARTVRVTRQLYYVREHLDWLPVDAVGEVTRAELAKSKARKTTNRSGTRVARNRRSSGESGR